MLSWSKGSYLSFHSQQEKKNRFIHFSAKTFGKRQTLAWPNQSLTNPQAGGPYRQNKSPGGSCGISDELRNIRASQPRSAGKNVSNLPGDT